MNLAEIKQKGENGGCFQAGDVYWLISQVEKLQSHLATFTTSAPSRERELQRLRDVAEAERDRYKAALERLKAHFEHQALVADIAAVDNAWNQAAYKVELLLTAEAVVP